MSDADILDWFSRLPKLEGYTPKDRHHDFTKTFGTTEGRRALRWIMELGGVFQMTRMVSPVDPGMLAAEKGRRWLALEILATINNEPQERPKRATSTKPRQP